MVLWSLADWFEDCCLAVLASTSPKLHTPPWVWPQPAAEKYDTLRVSS